MDLKSPHPVEIAVKPLYPLEVVVEPYPAEFVISKSRNKRKGEHEICRAYSLILWEIMATMKIVLTRVLQIPYGSSIHLVCPFKTRICP